MAIDYSVIGSRIKEARLSKNLTQEELYAQLIKHTRVLEYPRTVQGNWLVYLKDEKNMKKFKY